MTQIGTLREKPLHAQLKRWYAEPGDLVEQPVDGYVVDLVRDDLLIEIQTGGFAPMKKKLTTLLGDGHRVRIVAPVAVDTRILKVTKDGTILDRRMSPKHGSVVDLFGLLVSFPELFTSTPLEIELVLTTQDELRVHEPGKAWRRKGWVVRERHLVEVLGSQLFWDGGDLIGLLPTSLPSEFTTADIADSLNVARRTAQQAAYCLRKAGLITMTGKQGNAIEYAVA